MKRLPIFIAMLGLWSWTVDANAYTDEIHQQLTFMAARQFNHCVENTKVPMLRPLEVRYIVKANLREQGGIARWHFYDRKQAERRALWFIETSMHEHFNDELRALDKAKDPEDEYEALGSLLNYVQGVTSPVQAVPIYHPRWWRFAASDKFNHFEVNADEVEKILEDSCSKLFTMKERNVLDVLISTANATLDAIRAPIPGMNATWEAFWEEDPDYGDFGQYGEAGNNFGREAEFECGKQECQLLEGDPIYREFADERHAQAVLSTMKAMLIMQRKRVIAQARNG